MPHDAGGRQARRVAIDPAGARPHDMFMRATLTRPSRRAALQWGLAALGVAAAAGAALWPRVPTPEGAPPGHLSGEARAALVAFAGALWPLEGTPLTPVSALPFVENLERVVGRLTPALRTDLLTAIRVFDVGAVVVGAHGTRFLNLDAEAQAAYVARWASGNALQRQVFGALKQVVSIAYWSDARAWAPIGYDGPITARAQIPRLGAAPLPEA